MNLGGTVHVNKTGCCLLLGAVLIFFIYLFTSSGSRGLSPRADSQVNIRQLLAVAIQAAEAGGREVVAIRNDLVVESKGKTKEGANDSVTTADFKSHCVMTGRLKRSFPTLAVVSEEAKTVCVDEDKRDLTLLNDSVVLDEDLTDEWVPEKDVKVWIDPLDATQEYTEKLYEYVTTMVCVAVRGEPLVGVIHKPFLKETTWAWVSRGQSSQLKEPQLQNSARTALKFIVSRSHAGAAKEVIQSMFKDQKIEIISAGGAGYKALEVAKGNVDVYVHTTAIKKWDICAGNAILNSMGGRMTTKFDTAIDYANSDNPVNEEGIVATLKNHDIYLTKL